MTAWSARTCVGRPLADGTALGEHVDAVAQAHDQAQVVVDDDDRATAVLAHRPGCVASRASDSASFMPAAGSSSSSRLRPAGKRAGDLDAALLAVGERAREAVGGRRQAPSAPAPPATLRRSRPRATAPTATFSATVISRKRRICWNVRATPRRATRWAGGRRPAGPRWSRALAVGAQHAADRRSAASSCRSPLGPISPSISPARRIQRDAVERAHAAELPGDDPRRRAGMVGYVAGASRASAGAHLRMSDDPTEAWTGVPSRARGRDRRRPVA